MGEMAAAPPVLNAYLALSEQFGQTSLTPIEQQVVLATVSVTNGCTYCVAVHSAGLKAVGLPDDQIDAIRSGRALRDIRLEALRAFTAAAVEQRGRLSDADLRRFHETGYEHEQVLEVLIGVAMKTLSNYVNHLAHTPLDARFQPFAWETVTA
jgi:AhpD family alkylhydroperoxidase